MKTKIIQIKIITKVYFPSYFPISPINWCVYFYLKSSGLGKNILKILITSEHVNIGLKQPSNIV